VPLQDPQTRRPYGYRVIDTRRYELCAEFARASRRTHRYELAHPAGHHCVRYAVGAD
jgi:hypothetical protein